MAEYVTQKMYKAQAQAGVIDGVIGVRREQGKIAACREVLRDLRLDAKTSP